MPKTFRQNATAALIAAVLFSTVSAAQAQKAAPASTQPAPVAPAAIGATLQEYLFESGVDGWTAAAETVSIGAASDAKKSGKSSLKVSGTSTSDYFNFAWSPRTNLASGKQYQATAWVFVKDWQGAAKGPAIKIALYKDGQWMGNTFSKRYDVTKKNQWQQLTVTVRVPAAKGIAGLVSVEKGTKDQVKATMYIDDVKLLAVK